MLGCHSCGFSNLPRALFCGGCGVLLDAVECPVCNAANPRINRFCIQCGAALATPGPEAETDSARVEKEPPPNGVSSPPTQAVSPAAEPRSSLQLPLALPFTTAMASISYLPARYSTPCLISGAAAVVLAQLGLYFSVELNEKAPVGYLLLLGLGVAAFALGSLGLWNTRRDPGAGCSFRLGCVLYRRVRLQRP